MASETGGISMWNGSIGNVMERETLLTASPETSVLSAVVQMKSANVGSVMVVDAKKLVGLFTERDAVFRVMAAMLDPAHTRLADVMTTALYTMAPNESFG
jgi:CBS domain-containing protein